MKKGLKNCFPVILRVTVAFILLLNNAIMLHETRYSLTVLKMKRSVEVAVARVGCGEAKREKKLELRGLRSSWTLRVGFPPTHKQT